MKRPPIHRTLSVRLPAAEAAEVEATAAAGDEFVSDLIRRAVRREVRPSAARPSG